jgi:putative Mn2+ efflux pump MntP
MGWALFAFALVGLAGVVALTEAYVQENRGRILLPAVLFYFVLCLVGLSVGFDSIGRGVLLSFVALPIALVYVLTALRTR